MAAYFGVSTNDVARLRATQRIELDIDTLGQPLLPRVLERRSRPRRAAGS